MKKIFNIIVIFLLLSLSVKSQIIENFESASAWRWAPWVQNVATTSIGTVSATYRYSGLKGWAESTGTTWFYRTDVLFGSVGHKIGCWIKPAGPINNGRNYLGFGAKATGCFSVVAAPNTNTFIIQQNAGYGYLDLVSTPITWNKSQWYYMEATFIATNQVTARLYSSTLTLLATITMPASGTLSPGGAAFRTFYDGYFDDIGLNIPLPIELLEFNAKYVDNSVVLDWTTGSETNNMYFFVEKSMDGVNFERIGSLNGAINSKIINEYYFIDGDPHSGVNYYRLVQMDSDGKATNSDIISITVNNNSQIDTKIYPSVSKGDLYFVTNNNLNSQITVCDISGKVVKTVNSDQDTKIDISGLPNGVYVLTIINSGGTERQKIVLEK